MASKSSSFVPLLILSLVAVAVMVGAYWWVAASAHIEPETDSATAGAAPTMDPGQVDDALIAHIQAGRYEDAYKLMTRAYRASVPLVDFARAARQNRYLQTSEQIGCFRVVTWEDSVHFRECILHSKAGMSYATLHYALDEGEWRMTGILIGGTPAFPGVASQKLDLPAEAAPEETGGDEP